MSLLAFLIGTGVTTAIGWLTLGLFEGKHVVLSRWEQLVWGLILGPTLGMFVVFLSHIVGLTRLNLLGFVIPQIVLIVVLVIGNWRYGSLRWNGSSNVFASSKTYPRWITIGVGILCVWTAIKLLAGAYDLVSVPTYWDDSFNNWNMRGKIFFVTEELRLEIPIGNGVTSDAQGVSSYPVTLPLMKTWVSVLRGSWSDNVANSVHILWFAGLLAAFYLTLRRYFDRLLSAFGVYLLVSLPLLLIHGSNPYAEIFVASHVFLAAAALLALQTDRSSEETRTWTKLFFLILGLLILTKNESLLLHVPLLALAALTYDIRKKHLVSWRKHRTTILIGFATVLAIAIPWLGFKWFNGLTFGNAKSVTGVSFAFNTVVLESIWFHFTQEANWLILPFALLFAFIIRGREAWRKPVGVLSLFIVTEIFAQFALFTFIPALATEAIKQTGLSRGLLQIAPCAMLLLLFLMRKPALQE